MARFYARFDSGSQTQLDNDYFDKRRISTNSASGAQFRDGLIASRSAVSADVYDDLDSANKTSDRGTYFPPDAATFPTSTLLSWSTAYTSSVLGIKTPTSNTYGGGGAINYSQRPTASILSTMTAFVTKSVPNDPVQLNFDVYKSASGAVTATLNQIQNGAGTAQTPSTRTSYDTARTFFSLWNDPTMSYFAWDDFTPGTPPGAGYALGQSLNTVTIGSTTYTNALLLESTEALKLTGSWSGQFRADFAGTSQLTASLRKTSNDSLVTSTTVALTALLPNLSDGLSATWGWSGLTGLGTVSDGDSYDFLFTASFSDAIIPAHTSSRAMIRVPDLVHVVGVNAVSLRYAAAQNGLCGTNGTTATFYLSNGATQPSTPNVYVFSVKNPPTIAPVNYYVLSTETVINGGTIYTHDGGGQFTADTATCP